MLKPLDLMGLNMDSYPRRDNLESEVLARAIDEATSLAQQGNPSAALQTLMKALSVLQDGQGEAAAAGLFVMDAISGGRSSTTDQESMSRLEKLLGSVELSCGTDDERPVVVIGKVSMRGREEVGNETCILSDVDMAEVWVEEEVRKPRDLPSNSSHVLLENGISSIGIQAGDGSASCVCERCGDLISEKRMGPHRLIWCPAVTCERDVLE